MQNTSVITSAYSDYEEDFSSLTGSLTYSLTNDFLFKYSMQNNLFALKGLLAALLDLSPDDILSIEILNPIAPGDTPDDKICILDIKILLNGNRIINIEMQVAAQTFFPERSLTYLCRCFDNLASGDDWSRIFPCIQISILDHDLFRHSDRRYTGKFYSEYILKERTLSTEFSSKFALRMLSLNHLEEADDKDDPNGLYRWAKLFKATTWEDIKMIAKDNEYMKSVVSGLRVLSEDEKIRQACEARERDARDKATAYVCGVSDARKELEPVLEQKDTLIEQKEALIEKKDTLIAELTAQLEALKTTQA